MATVTMTKGAALPDSAAKTDFHNLVDGATGTVTGIVSADIASNAAIVKTQLSATLALPDSQLAQITTASKVHGSAITGLASLPAGAGVIPAANLSPTAGGTMGVFRNLKIVFTSATTVTVTSDELTLEDASFNKTIIRDVSQTGVITTAGAGGLDTGAEAANTIYYVWIIQKSSDSTVKALLSVKSNLSSAPTWPAGYDRWALVGCVGNDNSSNFISFTQTGRKYLFTTWATLASANVGVVSWTAIDLTPADMSAVAGFVPSALSTYCFGTGSSTAGDIVMTNVQATDIALATVTPNKYLFYTGAGQSGNRWEFDVLTADTIWYGDNGVATIYLHGFEINKLC